MGFAQFIHAGELGVKKLYESAIFVPWQFLSDTALEANQVNGASHLSFALGEVQIEAEEIPVNLSNIQVEIDTVLRNVGSSHRSTLWHADQMVAQITVSGFIVEKYVEQWISGVKARVHLRAECAPFQLLQESAQMQMAWIWSSQGTRLQAQLGSLELHWPKNSWKVGAIQCQGPRGFADVVQEEIKKKLENPESLIPELKAQMEAHFNRKMEDSLAQYRKPQWLFSDFQTALVMEMTGVEAAVDKGLVFKGLIHVQRPQAQGVQHREEVVALNVERSLEGVETQYPALIFPGQAVESLIGDMAENRIALYKLNQFSDFNRLLRSRFLQFFIWPDLMKYSKSAQFDVTSRVSGRPTLQYTINQKIWIQGYVDSWIYSQRDNRMWRYIDIRTAFSAWVYPNVEKGHLHFSLSNQNMKSSARMASEYVSRFRPSTHIGVSTIESSLKKAPFFQGFSLELPSLEMPNGKKFKAQRILRTHREGFIVEMLPQLEGVAGL